MRVAAFGDINIDVAAVVEAAPAPGEETFASRGRVGLGGSATNTAVVLAALGLEARIVGQVGADSFGGFALSELEAAGVDTGLVAVSPDATTGFILVTVTGGERAMIGLRGANAAFASDPGWVDGLDWLHLSAYSLLTDPQRETARRALDEARRRRVPVSIDVPSGVGQRLGPDLLELVEGATVVAAGMPALEAMAAGRGDPVRVLLGSVTTLAVTAGSGTTRLVRAAGEVSVTPPTVAATDSTGAGDSFVAGLVAASLSGLEPGATLTVATALGAAAVTTPGAGTSLGDLGAARTLVADGSAWPDAARGWLAEAGRLLGS